jgi:hypothetical protein
MAGHLLRYPAGGPYTATVELNPALVVVQHEQIAPIQRVAEVESGELWVFELSSTRRQALEVQVTDLHEADSGGLSGYTSLKAFIQTTLNYSASTLDLTHTDGDLWTVRYLSGLQTFREGLYQRWTGQLTFLKVV